MVALLKDISLAKPVRLAPARTGADHLYSTAALTNSAGTVVERYGYDAYGKRVTLDADGALRTTPAVTTVGFTGRTLDAETGLWYFRARYYSEWLGSYISRNEAGYLDGFSLFLALMGMKGWVDPTGLPGWPVDPFPAGETEEDKKKRAELLAKVRACIAKELEKLNAENKGKQNGYDCADTALTVFIRCAASNKLPMRFRIYDSKTKQWKNMDQMDYESQAAFEAAIRQNLGFLNVLDNTLPKDFKTLEPGDMIAYDLRYQTTRQGYNGHVRTVVEKKVCDNKDCYRIIEGHLDKKTEELTREWGLLVNEPSWPGTTGSGRQWNWRHIFGGKTTTTTTGP